MSEFFKFLTRFFHGWRRRIGVVTLVMALVFMVGWVRSLDISDEISTDFNNSAYNITSQRGVLEFSRVNRGDFGRFMHLESQKMDTPEDWGGPSCWDPDIYDVKWRFSFGPFDFGYAIVNGQNCDIYGFQYWSIVIPFSLLSAYLLLSKPRKSNQKKIAEPIPENVA